MISTLYGRRVRRQCRWNCIWETWWKRKSIDRRIVYSTITINWNIMGWTTSKDCIENICLSWWTWLSKRSNSGRTTQIVWKVFRRIFGSNMRNIMSMGRRGSDRLFSYRMKRGLERRLRSMQRKWGGSRSKKGRKSQWMSVSSGNRSIRKWKTRNRW